MDRTRTGLAETYRSGMMVAPPVRGGIQVYGGGGVLVSPGACDGEERREGMGSRDQEICRLGGRSNRSTMNIDNGP